MKTVFLPCIALSMLAYAQEADVAIIMKNDEPSLINRSSSRLEEFFQESRHLFENQNALLSRVIDQNAEKILGKLGELNADISYLVAQSEAPAVAQTDDPNPALPMQTADSSKEIAPTQSDSTYASPSKTPKKGMNDLNGGYNAPYRLGLHNPCEVYGKTSFLYWRPVQEGMQTYTLFRAESKGNGPGSTLREETYQTGAIDFTYQPAFKIGIGGNLPYDNWEIYSEYTWFNHDFTDSFNFQGPNSQTGSRDLLTNLFPDFCLKLNNFKNYLLIPSTLDSRFNLNLNWIFLELARNFYLGKHLTVRTHFGLRGDRNTEEIVQKFDLAATGSFNGNTIPTYGTATQTTDTWGVGPRAGFCATYQIPYGLNVYGDLAASLLYTQALQKAKQNSILYDKNVPDYQIQTLSFDDHTLNTVMPNLETSIGLGWGSNFNRDQWHLDLAVGFDFIAMWNQNLFRELVIQDVISGAGDGASARTLYRDLFIYGLNIKAGFSF